MSVSEHRLIRNSKVRTASSKQDAVRLLFILSEIGDEPPSESPDGSVLYIEGQAKLQALDFWLRNPDYLANELLNMYEADRKNNIHLLKKAQEILNSEEVNVRNFPMIRWHYGAFEALDEPLSLLRLYKFITFRKIKSNNETKTLVYKYYLLENGLIASRKLVAEHSILNWYVERCKLLKTLFGKIPGSKLKEIQHKQPEYHNTGWGESIISIKENVQKRLLEIKKNDKLD